jgi:hypothetical protein
MEQLDEPQFDESHINNIKDIKFVLPLNDSGDKQPPHACTHPCKAKETRL